MRFVQNLTVIVIFKFYYSAELWLNVNVNIEYSDVVIKITPWNTSYLFCVDKNWAEPPFTLRWFTVRQ